MLVIFIRLLAVFLMILVGVVARRRNLLDSRGTRQLALLVANILYPALIYSSLVTTFTLADLAAHWTLPAGTIMIMCVGFLVGILATVAVPFRDEREAHAFRFQCTINNYVFLPMPLVMMYWGNQGVALLVFSTIGSELSVWTLGILSLTGRSLHWRNIRHLLSMPMGAIGAAAATLALGHLLHWQWPEGHLITQVKDAILSVMDIFGKGTVPLAMMVAGSRMAELRATHLYQPAQMALLGLRLVVTPGIAVALLFLLPFAPETRRVLTVVAVMPSAIASVMLSDIYRADSEFAATSVLLTHAASLVTIPLWLTLTL